MLYPLSSPTSLSLYVSLRLFLALIHSRPTHMHTQQEHLLVAATRLCFKLVSLSGHKGMTGLWSL